MADMTEDEMEQKKGLLRETRGDSLNGGKRFEIPKGKTVRNVPEAVDWAKSGELSIYSPGLKRNMTILSHVYVTH